MDRTDYSMTKIYRFHDKLISAMNVFVQSRMRDKKEKNAGEVLGRALSFEGAQQHSQTIMMFVNSKVEW